MGDLVGVSVAELVAVLKRKQARLPFEIGAFVALESCEALLAGPAVVGPDDVRVGADGSVSVFAPPNSASNDAAARAVVSVLAHLLVAAGGGIPPALMQLVEHGPADGHWELGRLRDELEAVLVPLNRTASRRVLSRMLREAGREGLDAFEDKPSATDLDAELDALIDADALTINVAPKGGAAASPKAPVAKGLPPVRRPAKGAPLPKGAFGELPTRRSTRMGIGDLDFGEASVGARTAPRAGRPASSPPLPAAPAIPAGRSLPSSRPPPLPAAPRSDPPPPPPPRARPDRGTPSDIDGLLGALGPVPTSRAVPPPPGGPSPASSPPRSRPPGLAPPASALPPPSDPPTADFGRSGRGRGHSEIPPPAPPQQPPAPRPADHGARPLWIAEGAGEADGPSPMRGRDLDVSGLEELDEMPRGKKRGLLWIPVFVALTAALVALIFVLRPDAWARLMGEAPPEQILADQQRLASDAERVRIAQEHRQRFGQLSVRASPANAQILLFIGRGPATAENLPSGRAHEFVAIAEGRAPTRVVVPPDAEWTSGDESLGYEVAMQTGDAEMAFESLDLGETRLPRDVGEDGPLGTIRVVTSPPGAKVYQVVGFSSANIADLRTDQPQELLVFLPGHRPSRAIVGPSDWQGGDGDRHAEVDVILEPLPE